MLDSTGTTLYGVYPGRPGRARRRDRDDSHGEVDDDGDQSTTFRDLDELLIARAIMAQQVNASAGDAPRTRYGAFKGSLMRCSRADLVGSCDRRRLPQWQLRRTRARILADVARRHYEGAASGRRTQNWNRASTDPNAALQNAALSPPARCRARPGAQQPLRRVRGHDDRGPCCWRRHRGQAAAGERTRRRVACARGPSRRV
jgi:hypothetical protein